MNIARSIALAIFATLLMTPSFAQSQAKTAPKTNDTPTTCKDASGATHVIVGNDLPPECKDNDIRFLSPHGTVIHVIEGTASRAKRLEQEAQAEQLQKERDEQKRRDRVLLDTYLTVEDIERLRDQRLAMFDTQLKIAEQHITLLQDRLTDLRKQAARFKPYNDRPNAPPLPDAVAEALVNTVKSLAVDQQSIDVNRSEQATITANFERDIKRFKEIKPDK